MKNSIASIFLGILIGFCIIAAISMATFAVSVVSAQLGWHIAIPRPDERLDFHVAMLAISYSVIFLTTSLLSMLSDKNETIYWENLNEYLLINPDVLNYFNFSIWGYLSLAIETAAVVFGLPYVFWGSFITGMASVVVLYFKMVKAHFNREKILRKLKGDYRSPDERLAKGSIAAAIDQVPTKVQEDIDKEIAKQGEGKRDALEKTRAKREADEKKRVRHEAIDQARKTCLNGVQAYAKNAFDDHDVRLLEENFGFLLEAGYDSSLYPDNSKHGIDGKQESGKIEKTSTNTKNKKQKSEEDTAQAVAKRRYKELLKYIIESSPSELVRLLADSDVYAVQPKDGDFRCSQQCRDLVGWIIEDQKLFPLWNELSTQFRFDEALADLVRGLRKDAPAVEDKLPDGTELFLPPVKHIDLEELEKILAFIFDNELQRRVPGFWEVFFTGELAGYEDLSGNRTALSALFDFAKEKEALDALAESVEKSLLQKDYVHVDDQCINAFLRHLSSARGNHIGENCDDFVRRHISDTLYASYFEEYAARQYEDPDGLENLLRVRMNGPAVDGRFDCLYENDVSTEKLADGIEDLEAQIAYWEGLSSLVHVEPPMATIEALVDKLQEMREYAQAKLDRRKKTD